MGSMSVRRCFRLLPTRAARFMIASLILVAFLFKCSNMHWRVVSSFIIYPSRKFPDEITRYLRDVSNSTNTVIQMAMLPTEQNHTCRDPLCSEFLSAMDKDHFQQCVETVKNAMFGHPALGSCHFMNGSNRAPVALASFEGSGNTWVRGLLEQVTGICTGSSFPKHPDCDVNLRAAGFNGEAIRSSSVLVVKTHIPHPSWADGMTHKTSFRKDGHPLYGAAVLITRNPLNALVAEWKRQKTVHTHAQPHVADLGKEYFGSNSSWNEYVFRRAKVWKEFFSGWVLNTAGRRVLVVRYEDLLEDIVTEVRHILHFLKVPFSKKHLHSLKKTGFEQFHRKHSYDFDYFTKKQRLHVYNVVVQTIKMLAKNNNDKIFGIKEYLPNDIVIP